MPEWLVLFVFAMPFFFSLLLELFRLPNMVKYTLDIAWLLLLCFIIVGRIRFFGGYTKKLLLFPGIFFLATLIGFFLHFQSVWYYLWGIRNNIRFFVFFFACIFFLRERSIPHYFKFMDLLFWINLPVVLFQYFVLKKSQDLLGGIFGTLEGCNSYTNIFFLIVIARSVLLYMSGREKGLLCLTKCGVALIVAIFSELKVFMLELIVLVIMAVLLSKFTMKRLWILLLILFGTILASQILVVLFPHFKNWLSLEAMLTSASERGYGSNKNAMNRLTAISMSWEQFLPTWKEKMFGLGLGNCDYAAFDFLVSPFYLAYGELRYMWFSSSFLILETGLIGLVLYVLFFVNIFVQANKLAQKRQGDTLCCHIAIIMSVMSLLMVVYNGALRTEAGFMVYFVLALPFVNKESVVRVSACTERKVLIR